MKTFLKRTASFAMALTAVWFASCSKDEQPIEPALVVSNENTTFNFAATGSDAKELKFTTNQVWSIEPKDPENDWMIFSKSSGEAGENITIFIAVSANIGTDSRDAQFTLKAGDLTQTFTVYQAQRNVLVISNPDTYQDLSADGETIEVEFSANVNDYEVSFSFDADETAWIVQTDAMPMGRAIESHKLYFNVLSNDDESPRSAKIYIASDAVDATASIEISQQGKAKPIIPTITIDNKAALATNLNGQGDEFTVEYTTTGITALGITVSSTDVKVNEWLTKISEEAGKITYQLAVNATSAVRSATIKLYDTENQTIADEVTITQAIDERIHLNGGTLQEALTAHGLSQDTATSLTIVGELQTADWALLKTMATGGALKDLDLSSVTNSSLPTTGTGNNDGLFNGCVKLETLVLPTSGTISFIPINLCRNATNLKSIKIPEGVTYIDRHAFAGCTSMTKVWLPSTLTYLYGSCFEKTIFTEIHLKTKPLQYTSVKRGTDTPTTKAAVFANCNNLPKGATLYVPTEYVDLYKKQVPEPADLGFEAWPVIAFANENYQTKYVDFLWTNTTTVVVAEE